MNRPRGGLGRLGLTGLAGLAGLAGLPVAILAGCGPAAHPATAPSSTARPVQATIGPLRVSGGYIPQPASPDVAAAYLTITNTGATADVITKITTNVTDSVMAMTETAKNGVGAMTDLGRVTVPAHGQVTFSPGRAHLMLDKPTSRLRSGQHVRFTITFGHAGTLVLTLPVVPLNGIPPAPSMSMSMSMSMPPEPARVDVDVAAHVNAPVNLLRCPLDSAAR